MSSSCHDANAAGRLRESVGGSTTTRFLYDGADMIAEYSGSNALLRRYVFGPGADEALVWYEGTGTGDRRYLVADERGSIVAVTNSTGAASGTGFGINSYDEYGTPGPSNNSRFQYTGQPGCPKRSSTTTRRAPIRRASAASCKPILLGLAGA